MINIRRHTAFLTLVTLVSDGLVLYLSMAFAFWIRCQILFGVRGSSLMFRPKGDRASAIAFPMAAGTDSHEPSPAPLEPSAVKGEGVST